jgi:hypothetical protein
VFQEATREAIRRSFAPVVSGCGSALNVQAIFAYNEPAWFPPPTIAEEIRWKN